MHVTFCIMEIEEKSYKLAMINMKIWFEVLDTNDYAKIGFDNQIMYGNNVAKLSGLAIKTTSIRINQIK